MKLEDVKNRIVRDDEGMENFFFKMHSSVGYDEAREDRKWLVKALEAMQALWQAKRERDQHPGTNTGSANHLAVALRERFEDAVACGALSKEDN